MPQRLTRGWGKQWGGRLGRHHQDHACLPAALQIVGGGGSFSPTEGRGSRPKFCRVPHVLDFYDFPRGRLGCLRLEEGGRTLPVRLSKQSRRRACQPHWAIRHSRYRLCRRGSLGSRCPRGKPSVRALPRPAPLRYTQWLRGLSSSWPWGLRASCRAVPPRAGLRGRVRHSQSPLSRYPASPQPSMPLLGKGSGIPNVWKRQASYILAADRCQRSTESPP